jgi:ferredoxin
MIIIPDRVNVNVGCDCETRFAGDDDGCCGICVSICPEVFEIKGNRARVKNNVDIKKFLEQIKIAIKNCPVEAISLTGALERSEL